MRLLIRLFLITVKPEVILDYLKYYHAQKEKDEQPKEECTYGKRMPYADNCVEITLYTKKNLKGVIFSEENMAGFDADKKSVLLIHGWLSQEHDYHYVQIAKKFAEKKDMNALVVSWHSLANEEYFEAAAASEGVGRYIAEVLVSAVKSLGTNPEDIHLIGHSLGAHVSGYAGIFFKKMHRQKLGRITGLDPAKPGFTLRSVLERALIKEDAEFVDVVHSCTDSLIQIGTDINLGHIDIYVNGGSCYEHPHCQWKGIFGEPACAHYIPVAMIEYTINNGPFLIKKCSKKEEPQDGCSGAESKWGSEEPKKGTTGLFYLQLNEDVILNGLD